MFGWSWSVDSNGNVKGAVNGVARTETHLWSATASMIDRIIVSFS